MRLLRSSALLVAVILNVSFCRADVSTQSFGGAGDGVGLSLAFLPGNIPAFSFFNQFDGQLYYLAEGRREVVDSTAGPVTAAAVNGVASPPATSLFVIDSTIHIVYAHRASGELRHAMRIGGSWRRGTIAAGAGDLFSAQRCGASVCVSFFNRNSRNLALARGMFRSWSVQTVDSSPDVGQMSALAVRPEGLLAVAYYDGLNHSLKIAQEQAGGSWQIESLSVPGRMFGVFPSMLVMPDRTLAVSASSYQDSSLAFDLETYVFLNRDGRWESTVASDDYSGGVTRLLYSNRLELYSRYLRRSRVWGDRLAVMHGVLEESGRWSTEIVSGGEARSAFEDLNVALDGWSNRVLAVRRSGGVEFIAPPDADNDGVSNEEEVRRGTNALLADSDGDGCSDGYELLVLHSDPLVRGTAPRSPVEPLTGVRLEVGGQSYLDHFGRAWVADSFVVGGAAVRNRARVAGTPDAAIYQTAREGNFSYAIPLLNGSYTVVLYFAELREKKKKKRIFDVYAEGAKAITKLDLAKRVGPKAPLVYPLSVEVTDGLLELEFRSLVGKAQLAALEVKSAERYELRLNAGGGGYRDSFRRQWLGDSFASGGTRFTSKKKIRSTSEQRIYQSERRGSDFSYAVPLPPSRYDVTLHFAETEKCAQRRAFSVAAEGAAVIANLDLCRRVGPRTPLVEMFTVDVSDGVLDLRFLAATGFARVSAIEVEEALE